MDFAGIMHAAEIDDGDDNDMTTREDLAESLCGVGKGTGLDLPAAR